MGWDDFWLGLGWVFGFKYYIFNDLPDSVIVLVIKCTVGTLPP